MLTASKYDCVQISLEPVLNIHEEVCWTEELMDKFQFCVLQNLRDFQVVDLPSFKHDIEKNICPDFGGDDNEVLQMLWTLINSSSCTSDPSSFHYKSVDGYIYILEARHIFDFTPTPATLPKLPAMVKMA